MDDLAARKEFANNVMRQNGFAKIEPAVLGPVRESIEPDEVAETMAIVNANVAKRQAVADRRAEVKAWLDANRLGLNGGTA
jgi:hypothetical protein